MDAPNEGRSSAPVIATRPTPRPGRPEELAPVLAQAIRFGLRYFKASHGRGAAIPPEVAAMHGALQQYERAIREAEDARLVAPVAG